MKADDTLRQHHAEAVVLSCIDFRFTPFLRDIIERTLGISQFDLIQLAGGAKNLASPDSDARAAVVLEDLSLALRAHDTSIIVLVNHQQCGKYAEAGKRFNNLSEERAFHAEELTKAAYRIRREFPNIAIRGGFLFVNEMNDVAFENLLA